MSRTNFDTLLEAGCHFGHLKRKWNPAMAPYIFMERNGFHIIDLHKTVAKVDEAAEALKQIAKSGKKVLFVATKKQAKQVVAEKAQSVNMPYVIERWPGGMLTNFPTIVDTNSDPSNVDFVIPANDDATKSVEVILDACCAAMIEGLEERKAEKIDMEAAGEAPANKGKKKSAKARLDKSDEEAINAAKAAAFLKEDEEA